MPKKSKIKSLKDLKSAAKASAGEPVVDEKWALEDDMHTLEKAEEIKADAERLAKVKKHAKHKIKKIKSIADLKEASEMMEEEE